MIVGLFRETVYLYGGPSFLFPQIWYLSPALGASFPRVSRGVLLSDKKPEKFGCVPMAGCASLALAGCLFCWGLFALVAGIFIPTWSSHLWYWGILVIVVSVVITNFHRLIFRVPIYTEENLLTVLNTEWKSLPTLRRELAELRGVGDSVIDVMFRQPGYGWLSAQLDVLVHQGLVERRLLVIQVPDLETSFPKNEFRLSGDGLKRKDKVIASNKASEQPGYVSPQRI